MLPWLPNVLAHLHHFLNLFLSLLLPSVFTIGDWSALLCFALLCSLRRESVTQHIRWETLSSICRCCADSFHTGAIGEERVRTAPANLGVKGCRGSSAWNFGNIPPPFFEVIVIFSGGGAKQEKTQTWLRTKTQSRPSLDFVQIPLCDLSGGLEQRGCARRLSLNLFSFHPLVFCYECGWNDFSENFRQYNRSLWLK